MKYESVFKLLESNCSFPCFKGYRLNGTVIKFVDASSAVECVLRCVNEDETCRSINFRKNSNCGRNCEFLNDIASEKPDLLVQDEKFDYYVLLNPRRVSI